MNDMVCVIEDMDGTRGSGRVEIKERDSELSAGNNKHDTTKNHQNGAWLLQRGLPIPTIARVGW